MPPPTHSHDSSVFYVCVTTSRRRARGRGMMASLAAWFRCSSDKIRLNKLRRLWEGWGVRVWGVREQQRRGHDETAPRRKDGQTSLRETDGQSQSPPPPPPPPCLRFDWHTHSHTLRARRLAQTETYMHTSHFLQTSTLRIGAGSNWTSTADEGISCPACPGIPVTPTERSSTWQVPFSRPAPTVQFSIW